MSDPSTMCMHTILMIEMFPPRPFFDKVTIDFPNATQPLVITSKGAPHKPYIKSVSVNGEARTSPVLKHVDIAHGGHIVFEMSAEPQAWASGTSVSVDCGGGVRERLTVTDCVFSCVGFGRYEVCACRTLMRVC